MAGSTVRAVVLMTVPAKKSGNLVAKLKAMKEVTQAGALYGDIDIYAMVDVDSPEALNDLVMHQIQGMRDVKSTRTLLVIPGLFWSREPPTT